MKQKILSVLISCIMLICSFPVNLCADTDNDSLRLIFTHDIHSYLEPSLADVDGTIRERGGAARLSTIIKEYSNDNTIYLDGGDFSQGTLFQSGYETEAYELLMLGMLGCKVTTFGNHEWDHGSYGLANMLTAAMNNAEKYGVTLPRIAISNIEWTDLNAPHEELTLKGALIDYSDALGDVNYEYTILEVNGKKIGVFGLEGPSSIEDAPTANINFTDYIVAAQNMVDYLEDKCDIIIALSHSGNEGNSEEGDDVELAKQVDGIDIIISAHSHTFLFEPIKINDTYIVSSGEYLDYVGVTDIILNDDGTVSLENYQLVECNENVEEDPEIKSVIELFKQSINEEFLAPYGLEYDQVIAYSNFDFINLQEMYASSDEFPLGDLIADSYLYEAEKNGIDDIDVALVGLGTIRGSFFEGPITVADAFEICSLGVGSDGSSGHPLLTAYVYGSELKLLANLDTSLGSLVNSIKMSYSGMKFDYNSSRAILDRVTDPQIVKDDESVDLEDDKLYKVCCNMYAANMLGMLNGLTGGALTIVPKYADGTPVEDFYDIAIKDENGNEIKEWYAFTDYLMSFEVGDSGYPEIPDDYASEMGRKNNVSGFSFKIFSNPGATTWILIAVIVIVFFGILIVFRKIIKKSTVK